MKSGSKRKRSPEAESSRGTNGIDSSFGRRVIDLSVTPEKQLHDVLSVSSGELETNASAAFDCSTRQQGFAVRFRCSDVASICGLSSFANVPKLFMEYLYQDLEWLLVRDASNLDIVVVSEQERERELESKLARPTANALAALVKRASAPKANGEVLQEAALRVVAKEKTLTKAEASEILDTIRYKVFTQVGKTAEESVLDIYERQTGHPVRYRNEEMRAMIFPREIDRGRSVIGSVVLKRLTRLVDDGSVEFEVARTLRRCIRQCIDTSFGPLREASYVSEYAVNISKEVYFALVGVVDGMTDLVSVDEEDGEIKLEAAIIEAKHARGLQTCALLRSSETSSKFCVTC